MLVDLWAQARTEGEGREDTGGDRSPQAKERCPMQQKALLRP